MSFKTLCLSRVTGLEVAIACIILKTGERFSEAVRGGFGITIGLGEIFEIAVFDLCICRP